MVEERDEHEPVSGDVKCVAGLALVLAGVQQHAEEADAGNVDGTDQHGDHGVDEGSVKLEQQIGQSDPDCGGGTGSIFNKSLLDLLPHTLLFKCVTHK